MYNHEHIAAFARKLDSWDFPEEVFVESESLIEIRHCVTGDFVRTFSRFTRYLICANLEEDKNETDSVMKFILINDICFLKNHAN